MRLTGLSACRLGLSILWLTANPLPGQDVLTQQQKPDPPKIEVLVRDRASGKGVVGTVFILNAEEKKINVGPTDPKGDLALNHTCSLGERFRAEASDASYFPSNESRCEPRVVLTLRKRETPLGDIAQHVEKTIWVTGRDGRIRSYTLEWSTLTRASSQQSNALFCTTTVEGEIQKMAGEADKAGWKSLSPDLKAPFVPLGSEFGQRVTSGQVFCPQRASEEARIRREVLGELDKQLAEVVKRDLAAIERQLKSSEDVKDFSIK